MLRKSLLIWIVVSIGMMGNIFCGIAIGAERSKNISTAGEVTITTYEVVQDKLVLEGKGEDYVSFCARRFEVTSSTVIKDELGMDISLKSLPIPCEAMVSYYRKPRERNTYIVISIEVQGKPNPEPE